MMQTSRLPRHRFSKPCYTTAFKPKPDIFYGLRTSQSPGDYKRPVYELDALSLAFVEEAAQRFGFHLW